MKYKSSLVACLVPFLALAGCTDAAGRFDEFGQRITDAAPPEPDAPPVADLPDINGYFLMAIAVVFLPEKPILFYTEIEMTKNDDGTGVATFSATPLTVAEHTQIGDALVAQDVPISNAGEASANFVGWIEGAANPISGQPIELDCTIHIVIEDEDFYCGDVTGSVTRPTPLDVEGSTVGGIRIEEGTTGADLPEAVGNCPEDNPDAGVPDAGTPDADVADADVADADVTDA